MISIKKKGKEGGREKKRGEPRDSKTPGLRRIKIKRGHFLTRCWEGRGDSGPGKKSHRLGINSRKSVHRETASRIRKKKFNGGRRVKIL